MLAQASNKFNPLVGEAGMGRARTNEYPQTLQKVLSSTRAFLQKGQRLI